ncbi:Capsular associated protein [Mycena chlorophos]|uniref:Capsular associated protein n=1 Tax=Mycena chlorophos TaxID=658473 RepID=A0A8H6WNF0_MYCCL|nr:Capsular associated protein [Mycena chlorophos]
MYARLVNLLRVRIFVADHTPHVGRREWICGSEFELCWTRKRRVEVDGHRGSRQAVTLAPDHHYTTQHAMTHTERPSPRLRTPLVALLHTHRIFLISVLFSLSTAIFVAVRIGFFSTLFVYYALVVLCVPAVTIYDAIDAFNARALKTWPKRRRVRFALCGLWCSFMLFGPAYPPSGPSSYMDIRNPTSLPPLPSGNHTYFLAANLYEYAPHLPAWTRQLRLLIDHLGPQNVFVSIYESNSHDRTKALLEQFRDELSSVSVRNRVLLDDDPRRRKGWQSDGQERIRYMADMRNRALEPLKEGAFDRVVFFNDVYFEWRSIVRLLATKDGDFDLACALDFDGIGLYDTWVIRDSCGHRTKEIWPYFSLDPMAIDSLRREEPIQVASCWNGVAAFDARWFLPSNGTHTIPAGPALAFRADPTCTKSEFFPAPYDMLRTKPRRPRISVDPQVNVAYNPANWLYYGKIKHLALTRPWRVLWEDWIAHRVFGWLSDRWWLKDEEVRCPFEREGFVKAGHCAP